MGETPAPDVTRVERPASRPSDWESVGKEHRGQVRPSHHASRNAPSPPRPPPTTDTVQPPMWLKSNGQQAVPPTGSQWAKSIGIKYAQAITCRNASPPTDIGRPNTPLRKKLKKSGEYAFHKTHVKEGPQTPSRSSNNGLAIMLILKLRAASSRTGNDTLLGALLASASDSEGVPQPVHARARPPSAPCGTQELPLVAPSARRCTAAQSISAQRTETEWRRAAHAHADALCSMRSRLGCPALGQDHGGWGHGAA